jgi:hypothetical protein
MGRGHGVEASAFTAKRGKEGREGGTGLGPGVFASSRLRCEIGRRGLNHEDTKFTKGRGSSGELKARRERLW